MRWQVLHVYKDTQQSLTGMLLQVHGNLVLLFQVYCTAVLVLSMQRLPPCCHDRPKLFSDSKQVLKLLNSLHLLCGLMWAAEGPSCGWCELLDLHDSLEHVAGGLLCQPARVPYRCRLISYALQ